MHALRTIVTTGLTATLALGLGACGKDEPTDEASSTQSSPDASRDEEAVTKTFEQFWEASNLANPSKPASDELKALTTDELDADTAEFRKNFPKMTIEGKDKVTASKATITSDTEAQVEVCYEVHRKFIATDTYEGNGGTVKAGSNVRSDHNGRPIPDGAEMVNLIKLERDSASGPWLVGFNQVGYKPSCELEK